VGTETILAQYSGDSAWGASGRQLTVVVSPSSASASVGLAVSGSQLVLTGAVAPVAPGAGVPTGSVQFVDTSTKAVVARANLSGGKASATVAAAAASTVLARPIAALYSGDGNFTGSTSAPLPALVNAAGNLSLYGVFASTGQINFLVPGGAAAGWATVAITAGGGGTFSTVVNIASSAPGIFTANMTGQGPPAGQVIYIHADATQTVLSSFVPGSGHTYSPSPINLGGSGDHVYLALYGTGIRHAASLTATVNGVSIPVAYYGAQGTYAGLEQINLGPLPASLAGAGTANLVIATDAQAANTVTVAFQ
jgi:uncharacterized protein (TIGR03437 family)